MTRSWLLRLSAVGAIVAVLTSAVAGPASAHVTVNPDAATKGGFTKVAFRVPNESDTAGTTVVEVNLPTDTPIASVSLKPLGGWTAVATKTKITWTAAAGSAIKPGQFQEFEVSMGPLPDTDQVVFKTLQTYSDGTIVRWIDLPTTDGTEPEHPAPVLELAAPAAAGAATGTPSVVAAPADTGSEDAGTGTTYGVVGMLLGLAGLVAGLLAYRRAAQPRS
jgi:uncharacterized protein YcnI